MKNPLPSDAPIRTLWIFGALFLVSALLITFGGRSDADAIKSGVLTADVVDTAFEGVSGRLVERRVDEASIVRKGEPLLILDDIDTIIAIQRLEALLAQQQAALQEALSAKEIAVHDADLQEASQRRTIEERLAAVRSARSGLTLAEAEWERADGLYKSSGVSESAYEQATTQRTIARNTLVQAEKELASVMVGTTAAERRQLEKTGSAEDMTLAAIENTRGASFPTTRRRRRSLPSSRCFFRSSLRTRPCGRAAAP